MNLEDIHSHILSDSIGGKSIKTGSRFVVARDCRWGGRGGGDSERVDG